MRNGARCVPLSKRDYDIANALHLKEYGEELPVVREHKGYVNVHRNKCPRCLNHDVRDQDNYCSKCGAEMLEIKAVER